MKKEYGYAVYSPLLEGVLTVVYEREEALTFMRDYLLESPEEPLRLIENYPIN